MNRFFSIATLFIFLGQVTGQEFHSPNEAETIKSTDIGEEVQQNPTVATEWTYHESDDGLHPNEFEQTMVFLMNRARANPSAEGEWLATGVDGDVNSAMNFFGVNRSKMESEFQAIEAMPPAVFDKRLYEAAKDHSEYLISIDGQNHNGQVDRINDQNFRWVGYGGNVFSYSRSPVHAHCGFNVDWGNGTSDGMQVGRGHRKNLMSVDFNFSNVGFAAIEETNSRTSVGPYVVTQNFAVARTSSPDHYNKFITGTIYDDANDDLYYDYGEGVADVKVETEEGNFFCHSNVSGGYAIPVIADGEYTVIFGPPINQTHKVRVSGESVLLDINEICNIDPSISFEATASEICKGEEARLTVQNATSVIWSDGSTSSELVVTESGEYSVEVFDDTGCSTTYFHEVTVYDLPSLSIRGSEVTEICEGETVRLTAITDANTSIKWSTGAEVPTVILDEEGDYSVVVENDAGCTTELSYSLTVKESPSLELVQGDEPKLCNGKPTTLEIRNPEGDISWSNGSTGATTMVNEPGELIVSAVGSNGCTSTKTLDIIDYDAEEAKINFTTLSTCEGNEVVLSTDNTSELNWSTGETASEIKISEVGAKTVVLEINDNGCTSQDQVNVEIFEKPVVSEINGESEVEYNSDHSYELSGAFSDYSWTVENGNIVTGQGTSEIVVMWTNDRNIGSGQVCIEVLDENSCRSEEFCLDVVLKTPSSSKDIVSGLVEVFPNPVENNLVLKYSNDFFGGKFILNQIDGNTIFEKHLETYGETSVGISHLPSGVYIAVFQNENIREIKRLVKK